MASNNSWDYKKQLSDLLSKNYDLTSDDLINVSRELGKSFLPFFKQQTEFYELMPGYKQQLSALLNKNYDLTSEDVVMVSQELDQNLLPFFRQQMEFYNFYSNRNFE